ncbi:hypothetical protein NC653_025067 [Populus alba x Populus x berolinensis]|uniref:Uncharacterized protein n=1 Tax=Populus alba x Populus x berolinensis TaxID=444605 RepID=A0AAD6MAE4_9ROSI|nr:hypothetical protein NC653_025067 [Populus alba x Populus x berolinensis]
MEGGAGFIISESEKRVSKADPADKKYTDRRYSKHNPFSIIRWATTSQPILLL